MTPDAPDDDRTVIRPPGPLPEAGQQKTQRAAESTPASMDRTQIAAAPPSPDEDTGGNLPVGTRLREFEIKSLIGEGGFGIVYLAWDNSLERAVALKEYMPSSLAARMGGSQVQVKSARHRETFDAGLKSFINEARLLASFDHPSLVKVYQFWEANGTAYMVMPLLDGKTLKDVLRDMKSAGQPPDEAWLHSVLGPLTEALLVIHAKQVYHRDIAPDNVMLLPAENRWLLLDFGAARRVISEQTQALTVILKPGYAPVEQYAEIPGMKQGPWTDVYALAAVIYFAIVGRTPPPSVGRLLNDNYQPLAKVAAGRFSDGFLAAVDRALAVRPEHRTQSIGELRQDLGIAAFSSTDVYSSRAFPVGTEMPPRHADAGVAPTVALPTPFAAAPPAAAPRSAPPPAAAVPQAAATPAPAPAKKGNGAIIGGGVAAVLAIAGGAYFALTPSAKAPAPAVAEAPPAAAPVAAPPGAAVAPAPAPPPAPVAGPLDVGREFERIVEKQTPAFGVRVEARKSDLVIGRDEHSFSITAEREGYLYIIGYSPDGTLAQIVPNSMGGSVRVRKGQTWRFPTGDGFVLEAQDPPGTSLFLVMVSTWQRNHDVLKPRIESHVKMFPTDGEVGALAASWDASSSILAGRPLCAGTGPCQDEYGAALLRFNAVKK